MPRRRLFDKKNSVTYRLVPAEKTDDENAPKHIFVPVPKGGKKVPLPFAQSLGLENESIPALATRESLASSAANVELDPDVQAALEDDFNFDSESLLEDDFVARASSRGANANSKDTNSFSEKRKLQDSFDADVDSGDDEQVNSNYSVPNSKEVEVPLSGSSFSQPHPDAINTCRQENLPGAEMAISKEGGSRPHDPSDPDSSSNQDNEWDSADSSDQEGQTRTVIRIVPRPKFVKLHPRYEPPPIDSNRQHEENMRMIQENFGKLLESLDAEQDSQTRRQLCSLGHMMKRYHESKNMQEQDLLPDDYTSDEENLNPSSDVPSDEESSSALKDDEDGPMEMSLMDEKLKKMLETYDDDQIGALDSDDLDNPECGDELVTNMLLDYKEKKLKDEEDENLVLGKCDEEMKEKILKYANTKKPEEFVDIVTEKPTEFDCESILSTYSSIYNHPTVIKTDSLIPSKVRKQKLTKKNLKQLEESSESETSDDEMSGEKLSMASARPKNETPEERRMRKKIVKEAQRENRATKKENKLAFREEKRKQGLQQINQRMNAGMRII